MLFAEDNSDIGVCFRNFNMARRILDNEEREMNLIKGQFERLKDVARGIVLVSRIQSLLNSGGSKTPTFSDMIDTIETELDGVVQRRKQQYFSKSKSSDELNLEKLLSYVI